MKTETANFFWHGAPLSIYENACLSSFLQHGFEVHLWSYTQVAGPKGSVPRDASEILPAEWLHRYTQDGMHDNIAAFSDAFRFTLLSKVEGWWFDTDVLCLRDMADFRLLPHTPVIVGREDASTINGGVLQIPDPGMQAEFLKELALSGTEFEWGWIGPKLITRVMKRNGIEDDALPPQHFYPLHFHEADLVLRPETCEQAKHACDRSLTYHLWNEIIRRWGIPKNILPPAGSFLHQRFIEALPELAGYPALPLRTLEMLLETRPGELRRLQEFERRVRGNWAFKAATRLRSMIR